MLDFDSFIANGYYAIDLSENQRKLVNSIKQEFLGMINDPSIQVDLDGREGMSSEAGGVRKFYYFKHDQGTRNIELDFDLDHLRTSYTPIIDFIFKEISKHDRRTEYLGQARKSLTSAMTRLIYYPADVGQEMTRGHVDKSFLSFVPLTAGDRIQGETDELVYQKDKLILFAGETLKASFDLEVNLFKHQVNGNDKERIGLPCFVSFDDEFEMNTSHLKVIYRDFFEDLVRQNGYY